jgi:hypothetical protein
LLTAISQRFSDKRKTLEAEAAEKLSQLTQIKISSSQIILHRYTIDSVRTQARNDEAGVLIKRGDRLVPFDQESVLFQSIDASLRDENLDCYAPLPPCDEKKRRSIELQMREWFVSCLNRHFDNQLKSPEAAI